MCNWMSEHVRDKKHSKVLFCMMKESTAFTCLYEDGNLICICLSQVNTIIVQEDQFQVRIKTNLRVILAVIFMQVLKLKVRKSFEIFVTYQQT